MIFVKVRNWLTSRESKKWCWPFKRFFILSSNGETKGGIDIFFLSFIKFLCMFLLIVFSNVIAFVFAVETLSNRPNLANVVFSSGCNRLRSFHILKHVSVSQERKKKRKTTNTSNKKQKQERKKRCALPKPHSDSS